MEPSSQQGGRRGASGRRSGAVSAKVAAADIAVGPHAVSSGDGSAEATGEEVEGSAQDTATGAVLTRSSRAVAGRHGRKHEASRRNGESCRADAAVVSMPQSIASGGENPSIGTSSLTNTPTKEEEEGAEEVEEPIELELILSDNSADQEPLLQLEPDVEEAGSTPDTLSAEMNQLVEASSAAGDNEPSSVASDEVKPVETTDATSTNGEVTPAAEINSTSTSPVTRRKRKRSKKQSLSANRAHSAQSQEKEGGLKLAPTVIVAEETDVGSQNPESQVKLTPESDAPPALYPTTPAEQAWSWESCQDYFAKIAQENVDDLERMRKSQANFVAANPTSCRGLLSKRSQLAAMLTDARDSVSARADLEQRRGRHYRDVWEEEDYLAQLRRQRLATGDAEAADIPPVVLSNRELVFGYDDDLFDAYIGRLEDACAQRDHKEQESPASDTSASGTDRRASGAQNMASSRRDSKKKTKKTKPVEKSSVDLASDLLADVRPLYPNHQRHPASMGRWKLVKEKEADFECVHPASLTRDLVPVRWKEEAEADQELRDQAAEEEAAAQEASEREIDGSVNGESATETVAASTKDAGDDSASLSHRLPSFGDAGVEEDEVSLALATSVAKLIPLSMTNWRSLQTLYERAACAQQCASIFDAEEAARKSLEELYLHMYPTVPATSEPSEVVDSHVRPVDLQTRPCDLIAFSSRNDMAGECSIAVAASVEFAMTLQRGDEADVLDCNGCWNDGVVLDVFVESGKYPKFVLMRLTLWSEDVAEWIGVTEGRLLPRGVACGKMEFVLKPSQFRSSRFELNREVADALEQSYPQRHARLAAARFKRAALVSPETKPPPKRKRKRAVS